MLERTYIIPLRREWLKSPKYKRAKKAVIALKQFISRHMKAEESNVRLGKYLNLEVWKHGIKNPPGKIKVNIIKDDKGIVKAEFFGAPKDEVKKEETKTWKNEEKKQEVKTELTVDETKDVKVDETKKTVSEHNNVEQTKEQKQKEL